MIRGFLGTDLKIPLQLSGAEINLYPQVLIYDSEMNLLGTYDMTHQATGLYYYNWTSPGVGQYIGVFKVYTDAIHTILSADYGFESEDFIILNVTATEVNVITSKNEIIAAIDVTQQDWNVSAD